MTLVLACAMAVRAWGSRLLLTTAAVASCLPTWVARATIFTRTRWPTSSAPNVHLIGLPFVQLPCAGVIERILNGSLNAWVTFTPCAGSGPLLVTVIV